LLAEMPTYFATAVADGYSVVVVISTDASLSGHP
jgi:hypothetical protein